MINCKKHGLTESYEKSGRTWCKQCRTEAVVKCRSNTKKKLVMMKGGRCEICGYSKCQQALQFHHIDPTKKSFTISRGGFCRKWEKAVEEVAKCSLLCANCHAEVECGVTKLPGSEAEVE